MKKYKMLPLFLVCLLLFSSTSLFAKEREQGKGLSKTVLDAGVTQQNTTNRTLINVGAVAMWIHSNGLSSRKPDGSTGLFFPRGSNPSTGVIFQDQLVWGGRVIDGAEPIIRVGGGQYAVGHVPGKILSPGVSEDRTSPEINRVWRIRRAFADAELTQDAAEFNDILGSEVTQTQIDQLRAIYRQDWIDWPADRGAPFYDADGDGQYNPGFNADGTPKLRPTGNNPDGTPVEYDPAVHADEPGLAGADQVVWLVTNDLDPGSLANFSGSPAIGIEQQITLWAYARADELGQIIFKQFRFIYKGDINTLPNARIDSMYVTQWSDPDLGSAGDDLAGSDTDLSLGYAYNAGSVDAVYFSVGLPPPAAGYDFFAGPLVDSPGDEGIFGLEKVADKRNLPMSFFGSFSAGTQASDPDLGTYDNTLQWYNMMRRFLPRPITPLTPFVNPAFPGVPVLTTLDGDPVAGTGWIDAGAGDRRLFLVSGPFQMALGDTNEVVIATLASIGSDRLSSVSVLKFTDRFAQDAFDNLFELASAQPKPIVTASEFDGAIFINWGGNAAAIAATEETAEKGYTFEGYNVYQLPSAGASLDLGVRLATFDVVNEVTVISQEVFDQSSGLVLELPAQLGSNSGVQRTFSVNTDALRSLNLINGITYFFAVTAYNFNPTAAIKTLESTPVVVTVVPQSTTPGVRLTLEPGTTLAVEHVSGISDGEAIAMVLDPASTLDANYEVSFQDVTDADGITETLWNLINVTSGDTLVAQGTNQSGDANYLITDGLQVIVSGPPLELLDWDWEAGTGEFGFTRWTTGGPFGGEQFFGGAFLGPNFQGSNLAPADFRSILVEFVGMESFTDLNGNGQIDIGEPYQLRAGTGSTANLYSGFSAGANLGTATVPFSAFDMSVDPPRQLDIVVRDRDQNGQWDMHIIYDEADPNFVDVNGGDLQFNYVYILDTDYDATGANWDPTQGGQDYMVVGPLGDGGPTQMVLWMGDRGTGILGGDFTMTFVAPAVNTTADVFSFTSTGPTSSTALAKQDVLELVNVFPNPYLGFNRFEGNRFNRVVTFSHLPEVATIRIFNLAGILVRTIEKEDPSQFINWDLLNDSALPVAGGVYIANIEMPGLGTKNLKLAIVQEQQFLRRF